MNLRRPLVPVPSMGATGIIPALFAEWEAAYVPYLAALAEYSRVEEIFFADSDNSAKEEAARQAKGAMRKIERAVIDLEHQMIEAPAAKLANIRCKLRVKAKTIGFGDGDIGGASSCNQEVPLRHLAGVERIAGKAVVS
jgi:hypothetical protein